MITKFASVAAKTTICLAILLLSTLPSVFSKEISRSHKTLPDPLAAGWKQKPVCEKLQEDQLQRVLRCTFAPGIGHEKHFHVAHFGYALSGGKMRIVDATGTRDVELKTGSSYSSDGSEWHQVVNIGETTVSYLIVESKR